MANWKYKIDISDAYEAYHDDKIPLTHLVRELSSKLYRSPYRNNSIIVDIIHKLNWMVEVDCSADVDEVDEVLMELYHFGDEDHRLFIKTI